MPMNYIELFLFNFIIIFDEIYSYLVVLSLKGT